MKFFSGSHQLPRSRSDGLSKMLRALYPLTRSQQGIWLDYQMNPDSTRYNLTLEWTFGKDDLDLSPNLDSILEGRPLVMAETISYILSDNILAITTLTERYGALRSKIYTGDAEAQIEEHDPACACPSVYVMPKSSTDYDAAVINSAVRRSFDLENEFAVRWVAVQQKSTILLYLVSHHILLDGTSMSLLSAELVQLCNKASLTTAGEVDNFSQAHLLEVCQGFTLLPVLQSGLLMFSSESLVFQSSIC